MLILNLFISVYLDQIPPGKEMKEAFSIKLQTGNFVTGKIHAVQIRNITQSPGTFIRISGPILE